MKRSSLLMILVFAVQSATLATAQTAKEAEPPTNAARSRCPKVTVSKVEKPNVRGKWRFSAARSTDLLFHVVFKNNFDSEHVVTLKVFTPNGHIYRQYDVPVASDGSKRSNAVKQLDDYPYPVKVQVVNPVEVDGVKKKVVDVRFPVAGSTIITSSLYGKWRVELYLPPDAALDVLPERPRRQDLGDA
jgi:hypothetical protein